MPDNSLNLGIEENVKLNGGNPQQGGGHSAQGGFIPIVTEESPGSVGTSIGEFPYKPTPSGSDKIPLVDSTNKYTTLNDLISTLGSGVKISIQSTAPSSPAVNDVWIDTSGDNKVLKQYNGTSWSNKGSLLGPQGPAGGPGDTGPKGDSITVTSVDYDLNNNATITFSDSTQVIVYAGEPGPPGPAGPASALVSVFGRVGVVTPQASDYFGIYVSMTGSYVNPSWLVSLPWAKITDTPTTLSGYGITDAYTDTEIDDFLSGTTPISGYNKTNWDTAYSWGNHALANYALQATTITINGTAGRITSSAGSQSLAASRTWNIDLAASGVSAGTYTKVTVDTYGRVTVGASLAATDIPNLDTSKLTSGTLPITRGGTGLSSLGTATQLLRVNAAGTALEYWTNNFLTANQTITLSGAVTGSGATAITTTLASNIVGNSNLRDSAALSVIGRSANSVGDPADIVAGTDGFVLRRNGTTLGFGTIGNSSISDVDSSKLTGTIHADRLTGTYAISISGNAATVTNGVYTTGSYSDPSWLTGVNYSKLVGTVPTWNQNTTGSAATLTTARTLTIGATGKTFNGSANVSWSLSEIGATTVGANIFGSTNPSAITFLRANADNTVTWLNAAAFRTAIGAGTGNGSVTSVAAGNGLTFTTITGSGSVTLGTPSSITLASTNSVTTNSHTHALALGGTASQFLRGDSTLATLNLSALSDTTLASLSSGQLLQYNGTTWVNWTPNFLTANQTITLSGDVTGSGATSITTIIGSNAITTTKIQDSQVTYAKIQNADALSVIGRSQNTAGVVGAITAATDGFVLRRLGNTVTFGQIGDSSITDVSWSKIGGTPTTLAGYGITNGVATNRTLTINGVGFDLSADRSWSVGTVTSVAALTLGTTGTDLSSSVANGSTTPVITLNVPTASATNRGVLSPTDWTTFNNKQNALTNPVTGTGTAGQVVYWNGANSVTGDNNLFYTSGRLLLGTTSDNTVDRLQVNGTATFFGAGAHHIDVKSNDVTGSAGIRFFGGDALYADIYGGRESADNGNFIIRTRRGGSLVEAVRVTSGGNVGIGTNSPVTTLDVFGNTYSRGDLRFGESFTGVSNNTGIIKWQGAGASIPNSLGIFTWGDARDIQIGGRDVFFGAEASTARGVWKSNGNLLIGTTTDAGRRLNVNGSVAWGDAAGQYMYAGGTSHLFAYSNSDVNILYSGGSGGFGINNASDTVRLFQVTDGGNVGIGTTSPNSKLEVREANRVMDGYGNINVFTTNAFAANLGGSIALGGVSNTAGDTSPYPFAKIQGIKEGTGNWSGALLFGTTNSNSSISEKMRITSGGNVGINATDPSQRLDINGNIRVRSLTTSAGDFVTADSNGVFSRRTPAQVLSDIGAQAALTNPVTGTGASGQVTFWGGPTSIRGDNGLWWDDSNKRLGIGTTSPSGPLHIARTAATAPSVRLQTTNSTANGSIAWANSANIVLAGIGSNQNISDGSGNLEFLTGGVNTRMFLSSNGSMIVGGTTKPTETAWLGTAVFGRDTFNKVIIGSLNSSTVGAYVGGHNSGLTEWADLNIAGINVIFRNEQTERMRITAGGNLLVGTTTPLTGGGLVQINGQLNVATVNNATGDFLTHVNGIVNKRTAAQVLTDIAAVPTSRQINTQHSLTGGGDLTANRTLNLVGDVASPGNNKVYGTNGAETRGWYDVRGYASMTNTGTTGNASYNSSTGVFNIPRYVGGTGTTNRVAVWSGANDIASPADFWWDGTNKRLGLGRSNPVGYFELYKGSAGTVDFYLHTNVGYDAATPAYFHFGTENYSAVSDGNAFRYRFSIDGLAAGKNLVISREIYSGGSVLVNENMRWLNGGGVAFKDVAGANTEYLRLNKRTIGLYNYAVVDAPDSGTNLSIRASQYLFLGSAFHQVMLGMTDFDDTTYSPINSFGTHGFKGSRHSIDELLVEVSSAEEIDTLYHAVRVVKTGGSTSIRHALSDGSKPNQELILTLQNTGGTGGNSVQLPNTTLNCQPGKTLKAFLIWDLDAQRWFLMGYEVI